MFEAIFGQVNFPFRSFSKRFYATKKSISMSSLCVVKTPMLCLFFLCLQGGIAQACMSAYPTCQSLRASSKGSKVKINLGHDEDTRIWVYRVRRPTSFIPRYLRERFPVGHPRYQHAKTELSYLQLQTNRLKLKVLRRLRNRGFLRLKNPKKTDFRVEKRWWQLSVKAIRFLKGTKNKVLELVDFGRISASPLKLSMKEHGPGLYFVEAVQYSHMKKVTYAAVHTMAIHSSVQLSVKRTRKRLLVFAAHRKSGKALPRGRVVVFSKKKVLARGRTNKGGWKSFRLPLKKGGWVLFQRGRESQLMKIPSLDSRFQDKSRILYTDRPVYLPGQWVHFKSSFRIWKQPGKAKVPSKKIFGYSIVNGAGTLIHEGLCKMNKRGSCWGKFQLSKTASSGQYALRIHSSKRTSWGNQIQMRAFQVASLRKTPPKFPSTPPKIKSKKGTSFLLSFSSKRRFFLSREKMRISLKLEGEDGSPVFGKQILVTSSRDGKRYLLKTDPSGNVSFLLKNRRHGAFPMVAHLVGFKKDVHAKKKVWRIPPRGMNASSLSIKAPKVLLERDDYRKGEEIRMLLFAPKKSVCWWWSAQMHLVFRQGGICPKKRIFLFRTKALSAYAPNASLTFMGASNNKEILSHHPIRLSGGLRIQIVTKARARSKDQEVLLRVLDGAGKPVKHAELSVSVSQAHLYSSVRHLYLKKKKASIWSPPRHWRGDGGAFFEKNHSIHHEENKGEEVFSRYLHLLAFRKKLFLPKFHKLLRLYKRAINRNKLTTSRRLHLALEHFVWKNGTFLKSKRPPIGCSKRGFGSFGGRRFGYGYASLHHKHKLTIPGGQSLLWKPVIYTNARGYAKVRFSIPKDTSKVRWRIQVNALAKGAGFGNAHKIIQ